MFTSQRSNVDFCEIFSKQHALMVQMEYVKMAQQQTENINDIQSNESTLNESKNLQNGVENKIVSQNYRVNSVGSVAGMSEQKSKSPGAVGANNGNGGPPQPIDHMPGPMHSYGEHPSGHLPPDSKDDPHNMYGPPHPMHHPQPPQGYSRYHDPNMPPDMYGRYGVYKDTNIQITIR
ncbi:hypothetical protein Bhyg_16344 [Pseudolycoriella hygida]|uniref:Uncharacterized protein n=1 Tax=Pseudolycoriella hygida TaxID=35572 RepID=A0A9Q0MNJ7_9DIPT|nr:hypothetical protein Bhyg_16344 [Pseudolycoriella hygida]